MPSGQQVLDKGRKNFGTRDRDQRGRAQGEHRQRHGVREATSQRDELYANVHRSLRALRKYAPYFTRFTQICTVVYELYASLHDSHRVLRAFMQINTVFYELHVHLHRILRGLRKFAPCFTSLTQFCIVFFELCANLHRILRALRKFAPYFMSFTQFGMICIVFYELSV